MTKVFQLGVKVSSPVKRAVIFHVIAMKSAFASCSPLVLPAFGRPSGWAACRPLAPRVVALLPSFTFFFSFSFSFYFQFLFLLFIVFVLIL